MNLNIAIKIAIGVVGYSAWAIMAYLDPTQRPDFLRFNIAMAVGTIGLVLRDMQAGSPPAAPGDKQGGRALPGLLAVMGVGLAIGLSGCGAINAYTGAALNAGESGYVGARQNIKSSDDMKLILWADAACAMPLGALQRNATGNPYAVSAILTACPIPNVGIVQAKDGQVQVQITQAAPTPPYLGTTAPQQPTAGPGK